MLSFSKNDRTLNTDESHQTPKCLHARILPGLCCKSAFEVLCAAECPIARAFIGHSAERGLTIEKIEAGSVIQIYNQLGVEIYRSVSVGNSLEINTGSFGAGLYFIRVNNGQVGKLTKL